MVLRIIDCFKTTFGIVVLIELPQNFIITPGMKIKNNRNEIWAIKSVSFQSVPKDENLQSEMLNRGYHIEPLRNANNELALNCESLLNIVWEVVA